MLRLIINNLWLKKARSVLTLIGLALATATMFALLAFKRGYERGLKEELDHLGAQILVVPKGCPYDAASLALHGANWPCFLKESYLADVAGTPGIAVAAPVLMAAAHGYEREIVVGITPEYLKLHPSWKIQGTFPTKPREVILGAEAARRFNATVGGRIRSKHLNEELHVAGILQPVGGPDDDFTFLNLREAQALQKKDGLLTHVLVKLKDPNKLDAAVQALRGCDAGMQMNIVPLAHLFETIRRVSASAQYLLAAIAAVSFLIGGTALANTMFMAVLERTREIGVLRALGASTTQVFSLFFVECLLLGFLGALLGLAGAGTLSRLLEEWVRAQIAYAPSTSLIRFDTTAIIISATFAIFVATVSGLLPALRAARLNPVVAFRAQAAY